MNIVPETPPTGGQLNVPPAPLAAKPDAHRDAPAGQEAGLLVIGPRVLPSHGTVQIWADAGSGGIGQRADVAVNRLRLAEIDSGEGVTALYRLETSHHRG